MEILVTKKEPVEVKYLEVKAGVRYWEDAEINGKNASDDGSEVPFAKGELWNPVIDVDSGTIVDWPIGVEADVHFKVCDNGSYYLKDARGNVVASIENDYVPDCLCPLEPGYGDYIIIKINGQGEIDGWEPNFEEFLNTEE